MMACHTSPSASTRCNWLYQDAYSRCPDNAVEGAIYCAIHKARIEHGKIEPEPKRRCRGRIVIPNSNSMMQCIEDALPGKDTCAAHQITIHEQLATSPIKKPLLEEAAAAVLNRRTIYGSPLANFERTARLYSAYLQKNITPSDVANLNILQKISRLQETPNHRDSWLDIAGYAECGDECQGKKL